MRRALLWVLLSAASMIGWLVGTLFIVPQIIFRLFSRKYDLWYYLHQIAVGNDVMAGSMIYGSKHTVSAITGYRAYRGDRWHRLQEKVIDFLFGKGHCRREAADEGLIKHKGTR